MDLEEIKKKLYEEGAKAEGKTGAPRSFEPGQGSGQVPVQSSESWQNEPGGSSAPQTSFEFKMPGSRKNLKYYIIGGLVILLALAGFIFWRQLYSFDKANVFLMTFGPERIVSGEEVSYIVKYKNNSRVTLKNVKLTFIYPSDAIPIDKKNLTKIGDAEATILNVDNLDPGKEAQIEIRANVAGLQNQNEKATVKLAYTPANVSTEFENTYDFTSLVFSVPLVLDFDLPDRAVSGQQLNFALKYVNTSEVSFSDLVLKINYPPGFTFLTADRPPDQGSDTWNIGEVSAKEEGRINISGTLTGTKEEIKSFKAQIGHQENDFVKAISEGVASAVISVSPLAVEMTINNFRDYTANPGEELDYQITFQNTVDVPINSAFINLKFDTKVLDFRSLRVDKGFFNSLDSSITWNESGLSDLKLLLPGDKKTIGFTVLVKSQLPIANFSDKNFVINATVKIDSTNIPLSLRGTQLSGQDSLSTKLNSKLILKSKGIYYNADIVNSGPMPPAVGQQTTYNIYWQVMNLSNDVDNVVVESYLPPYVRWMNNYQPSGADIKYDSNTGKITWNIGKLSANTGILSLVKGVVFQIGLIPAINQVGEIVELIKQSTIHGRDIFTNVLLQSSADSVTSELPDDPAMPYDYGRVRN